MQTAQVTTHRFNWILDALSTRVGISAVVGLLICVCAGVGYYIQTVGVQLEENHSVFRDRQARNGYTAMSDVQRLILVLQRGLDTRSMTPELVSEFRDATDILAVRTDNFKRIVRRQDTWLPSGEASIIALDRIVDIADTALADGFDDIWFLHKSLVAANAEARAHLVQFLDDMRRQADAVLEKQSRAVRKQQVVVLANLAGLTIVVSIALILLRREVLGRRARELAEQRVEYLAYFDPLTKLPNRTQFQEHLHETLQEDRPVALIYLDLDDFKLINDTHGHAAGDAVLCHVGGILRDVARQQDGVAARLAGDEFALLVPGDDIETLSELCEAIIATTSETHWFEGEAFVVGVSLGIATTTQLSASGPKTVDMLSRVTDFALYTSKATGRKCYTIYDHIIEKRFWDRRALIDEMPRAIEQRDLEVYLQPKVTLQDRCVYGFEALVRWHRNGQMIAPNEFISIAEESGLVVDIDRFVLREAVNAISNWNDEHGTEFSVSVNLSATHFNSPEIARFVEQTLWRAGLPSHLLTLEITETSEMRDWEQAKKIISDLKTTGCKIAIDDFGTGFSSLAYLRAMNAHELKVDRSLISELETSKKARLLLSSVLEIARNFELEVTIEGIECEGQATIVTSMGAPNAQGYHFGRPAPLVVALATATPDRGARRGAAAV